MKLIIAAGGTGGHIYPGIAVAKRFKERYESALIAFIGSDIGHEKGIIEREGFRLFLVRSRKFIRKPTFKNIWAVLNIPFSVFQCSVILCRFKPDAVFLTGGFVSLPVAIASSLLGIPLILHEQNVLPGLTIKLLSRFSSRICLSWIESKKYLRGGNATVTGNPIRKEFLFSTRQNSILNLNLDPNKKTIVVLGGSQGARSINEAVSAAMTLIHSNLNIQILHIAGERDYNIFVSKKTQNPAFYRCVPYMHNIWDAISAADLIISRAGATTLAEIAAKGVPSILIPYPHSAEGHQQLNADVFKNAGAACVLNNGELLAENLFKLIYELIEDNDKLNKMSKNALMLARIGACDRIVEVILNEIS